MRLETPPLQGRRLMSATTGNDTAVKTYQLPSEARPVLAVLIPCYNEAAAIGKVVKSFRAALPDATIFVYDNNSTDDTSEVARRAGAVVRRELQRGKGNVVRRMFADIEADVFILVDGDDTYDASCARTLIDRLLSDSLDMVNASRTAQSQGAYRPGHRFGNLFLTSCVSYVFGDRLSDMLSGYRVFSRRFVKSFPALASGFEIETELTVHALELRLPIAEVPTRYGERPQGSTSKLHTYRDGVRILLTIIKLIKLEKPLHFFGVIFAVLALVAVAIEIPVLLTYLKTGLVPRLPTALLGTGMMLLAFLSLVCGLILQTVTRGRIELKRLHYLAVPLRFNNVGASIGALPVDS
jgi:glycosyltransferase involved in cell wall biosynthesis